MLFKDIKQNYPVFILNKQDLSLIQGKATQVPFPRMEVNQKTGKTEMVIDVTIEANGKTATYVIPENLSVTYAGNLILSTDKMSLASEIEAMKNTAEQVLASVDHHKEVLEKSSSLLARVLNTLLVKIKMALPRLRVLRRNILIKSYCYLLD